MGPNLFGIVGATAGSTDFAKYKALKGSTVVWHEETLDGFLADPSGFAGGKFIMKSLTDRTARGDAPAEPSTRHGTAFATARNLGPGAIGFLDLYQTFFVRLGLERGIDIGQSPGRRHPSPAVTSEGFEG